MAANVLVDAGFLVALLLRRDTNPSLGSGAFAALAAALEPPARLHYRKHSHLLGDRADPALAAALQTLVVISDFNLNDKVDEVLKLMQKYADVPMSLPMPVSSA